MRGPLAKLPSATLPVKQRRSAEATDGSREKGETEKEREAAEREKQQSEAAEGGKRQRSGSGSRSGALGFVTFLKLDHGMMISTVFSS